MNIPVYRAKKIDSDEYVIGYYDGQAIVELGQQNISYGYRKIHLVDPSTLAISFPDMLDSENNPIFASLSDSGKGGDRALYNGKGEWVSIYYEHSFQWKSNIELQFNTSRKCQYLRLKPLAKMKVIGIQN